MMSIARTIFGVHRLLSALLLVVMLVLVMTMMSVHNSGDLNIFSHLFFKEKKKKSLVLWILTKSLWGKDKAICEAVEREGECLVSL